MKASIVDLRYKMNDVLKALDRKEEVTVLYRGRIRGRLVPANGGTAKKVQDHAFFGMSREKKESVLEELARLREARVHDI